MPARRRCPRWSTRCAADGLHVAGLMTVPPHGRRPPALVRARCGNWRAQLGLAELSMGMTRRLRDRGGGGRHDGAGRAGACSARPLHLSLRRAAGPVPYARPARTPRLAGLRGRQTRMASMWRRAMVYLGLQDDDELDYGGEYETLRRLRRPGRGAAREPRRAQPRRLDDRDAAPHDAARATEQSDCASDSAPTPSTPPRRPRTGADPSAAVRDEPPAISAPRPAWCARSAPPPRHGCTWSSRRASTTRRRSATASRRTSPSSSTSRASPASCSAA